LVGCERSGTTLLQSMLAAHPQLASFPESHFFIGLAPRSRWRRALGLASRKKRPRFESFLREVGAVQCGGGPRKFAWTMRRQTDDFVRLLDSLALSQGKDRWIEKTPGHLRCLPMIEKYVPGARFIHLVRNGQDVVASLYEVARRFPETWSGQWTVERCVGKWNADVQRTRAQLGRPNHFLVRYEQLIVAPEAILRSLCQFLGVAFVEPMLTQYHTAAHALITPNEPWKHDAKGKLRPASGGKFERIFNERERRYILNHLDPARDLLSEPAQNDE
jgi:hypothetical protein